MINALFHRCRPKGSVLAATMLAVFACLLIGTLSGDVLAVFGKGHAAVELASAGKKTLAEAHIPSISPARHCCVDDASVFPARVEASSTSSQHPGSKGALLALASHPQIPSLDAVAVIDWPPAPVDINPILKHHRTVVLLN